MKKIVSSTPIVEGQPILDDQIESICSSILELNKEGLVSDEDYETIREILYRNHSNP